MRTICAGLDAVALVREVFSLHGSGETVLPDEAYLGWRNGRDEAVRSLNMPGYVGGSFRAAGTKIINSNPGNVLRGLPRANGLTLLFDPDTVEILCVMEGASISALRTAAVSALCIGELAGPALQCMAVIGAGRIGAAHAELALRTFPSLRRVVLYDANASAAHTLADTLKSSGHDGVECEIAASAQDAVQCADALVAATTVTAGYIRHEWIKPGAVVVNVSLDDLLPEVFLKADLLFVDDWGLVRADSRRLLGKMYREGKVAGPDDPGADGVRRVDGEIGDFVLARHPGRTRAEEIIVVNPFGLAIEDVAFASRVFGVARQQGLGVTLGR